MDAKKFLEKRDRLVQDGTEFLLVRTIGQHTIDLIRREGDISAASLMESLRLGLAAPADEKERLLTQAALEHLQRLSARRG